MIEILFIFALSVWIRKNTESKGYKWWKFVIMTIFFWFLGEFVGLFIGLFIVSINSMRSGYIYVFALTGALMGGVLSIIIVKSLKQIDISDNNSKDVFEREHLKTEACWNCGYEFKRGDNYCRKCGSAL